MLASAVRVGVCAPGSRAAFGGVGRRWSPRRGMPFLGVGRGVCRGALFLGALVPAPAPSWFLGGFLPPCGVSSGALSLWVPAFTWGPLPECPLVSLALPLPLSFPFLVWWWQEGRGWEGAPLTQVRGWVAWSHWRRAWGV